MLTTKSTHTALPKHKIFSSESDSNDQCYILLRSKYKIIFQYLIGYNCLT